MANKHRVEKLEEKIGSKDDLIYTLVIFGEAGKEVTVSDDSVMSAEEYWRMKPNIKSVTVIDPFMEMG